MRRATAWFVVVGVAIFGTVRPLCAAEGFWVSIATGIAGASAPTGYQELWFETPHGPPQIAITQLTGGTAEATTGGGSTFFSNAALPVVLNTTDGYGYVTGNVKPPSFSDSLQRQMAGGKGLASAAPDAGASTPPTGANLLSVDKGPPDATGGMTLSVSLTDQQMNLLAGGSGVIPSGGWWVIGLGPNPNGDDGSSSGPDPLPDPEPDPEPGPEPDPNQTPGGPVATPEPTTLMLAGIGGLGALGWRRLNRGRNR